MSLYVIDDHPMVRQMIGMLLRRLRPASKVVELEKYSELQAALIKNGEPELFVLDLLLPGVKGATAISDVKKMYPEIPLVVLSAMPSGEARDACLEAGADLAFVEGPKDKEEVAHICQAVKGPVFYNMTGISPRFTAEEMAAIGIRACILPGAAMRATIMAIHDFATTLKAEGPMAEAAYDARFKQHPMGNLHGFAGFDRIREMEAEFLPAEAAEKYQGGLGYAPKAAE